MGGEFVDSNILVYAHDSSAGAKRRKAAALIERLAEERAGLLSTQVLAEFFMNVTAKVPRPLDADLAAQIMSDFATWRVVSPKPVDLMEAVAISQEYRIHFWDALIIRAAECLDARVVWSEDLNAGQLYRGIEVRNPFL